MASESTARDSGHEPERPTEKWLSVATSHTLRRAARSLTELRASLLELEELLTKFDELEAESDQGGRLLAQKANTNRLVGRIDESMREHVGRLRYVERTNNPVGFGNLVDFILGQAEDGPVELADLRMARNRENEEDFLCLGQSYVRGLSPGQAGGVWTAFENVAYLSGYQVAVVGIEESGSVFRNWAFRGSRKAARRLAEGGAAAVNDTYARRPGAEATRALAEAVSLLLNATQDEAVHVFDNMVVGRFRDADGTLRSFSKELTLRERRTLDLNPQLLQEPGRLLMMLRESHDDPPPIVQGETTDDSEPPSLDTM